MNTVVTCRGCGKALKGTGWQFDSVMDPDTNKPAKWNHYGGWVCSKSCDRQASIELERSMPGSSYRQTSLSCFAEESLRKNWPLD